MDPSTNRISRSSKGSRHRQQQPAMNTVQESGGQAEGGGQGQGGNSHQRPGAFRVQGNRPSENDDIITVTMVDSDVDDSAPSVAEESVFRVPEARLVDPEATQAAIARAVQAARDQTARALREEILFQEETQERQLLQERDKPEEESPFRIQAFIRKHSFVSCAICSIILLLGAGGAAIAVALSSNDEPSSPSSVSTPIPTEVPTAAVTTPSPSLLYRVTSWTQVGSTLTGVATGDRFGDFRALSLSLDGSILAVGAPLNDEEAEDSGLVEVFQRETFQRGGTDQQQTEEWKPMGAALKGVTSDDQFGSSVALSGNGQILAVGASEPGTGRPGYVLAFEYDSTSGQWTQLGSKIEGVDADDLFGTSVALSSDEKILAVGALNNDDNGSSAGHVRVFTFDSNTNEWVQKGSALTGGKELEYFGWALDLSADGAILAVGIPWNDDNGSDSGYVRAFQFNNNFNDWDPLGAAIPGVAELDYFGRSVALSADGFVLAAGAGYNDENGLDSGHVRVFDYNGSTNQWIQRGSAIVGVNENDAFGWSVAVSADGDQVAAGAIFNDAVGTNSGHIRVFRYEESSGGNMGQWTQVGEALTGVGGEQDYFGRSVAMSADGRVVAGSASEGNNDFLDPGYICVYEGVME